MGQVTPNIGIYIPATAETNYDSSFSQGMFNIDSHDHSGSPTGGLQISTSGLADGSVTLAKANADFINTGVFTPTVTTTNGALTNLSYISQQGNWQTIGKWIMIDLEVVFTANPGTGFLRIEGLPVASIGTYWLAGYTFSINQTPSQQVMSFNAAPGTQIRIFPVGNPFQELPVPAVPFQYNLQCTGIYQWAS